MKTSEKDLRELLSPRQDLSFTDLKIYYTEKGYDVGSNFERQLDFFTTNGSYNFTSYLFSDHNDLSIQVIKHSDKEEVYEFGHCSIIQATYRILEKLRMENKNNFSYHPENDSLYDYEVVREVVINAMIHNDWTISSPIFHLYPDHLEIESFAKIEEEKQEDFFLGNLVPINRDIMRIFKDLYLASHLGTGLRKILKKYSRNIYSFTPTSIQVVIPYYSSLYTMNTPHNKKSLYRVTNISSIQSSILKLMEDKPGITQDEMALLLNVTARTVRNHIKYLMDENYVERRGATKKGEWQVLKHEK